MAIADDFSVSVAKDIRYTGTAHGVAAAGYYTVIELHRWLMDIADDAEPATANDLVDITSDTPSDRSTDNIITLINGYNIDQTASEHLYDGTIIQGDTGVDRMKWDGLVIIANEGMDLQIMQDGAQLANDFWNEIPDGETAKGLNRDVANGISHRMMVLVHDFLGDGGDIDGRRLIGMTRVDFTTKDSGTKGKTYSEFKINGTSDGNNVMALTFADDLNDTADASGFSTITNTEGYRAIDVNNDSTDEYFYSEWNKDTYSINQLYQRIKYLSRGDSTNVGTLYGIDAKIFRGITNELAITGIGGTWVEPESLSWTGGTGQLLAVDNTAGASTTKLWMQILTGTPPSSGTITGNGGATGTVTGNTERTVSTPFIGVSTGTALIGAYGFGVEYLDLAATDTVFDLIANAPFSPPNNTTFTVSGVVNLEDRILVGPDGGSTTLDYGQFAVSTTVAAAATTLIVKLGTETPGTGTQSATDTPSTGTIRVQEDTTGIYQRVTYTGYTVGAGIMTFTGCSGMPDAAADNDVFISYIDELYVNTAATQSYTATFWNSGSGRDLFVRVRDGGTAGDAKGIKTFETSGTLADANTGVTAIRTSDV